MAGFREQWEAAPLWQKAIIILVLPGVLLGAIWFYAIKPDMEERDKLVNEREQLRQEVEKYRKMSRPEVIENLKRELERLKGEEEEKRRELESMVGKLPTKKEVERVFGEINSLALSNDLVITRIAVSEPKDYNVELVENGGKRFLKQVDSKGAGVPITTMEVSMSFEGSASGVYRFLKGLQEKGIVSYPKSIKLKPVKEKGLVSADIVIEVVLQR